MSHRSRSCIAAGAFLVATGLVACSNVLGFDDLTSSAGVDGGSGSEAGNDASADAITADGPPGTVPGAPSGVLAGAGLVTTLAGSGTAKFAEGTGAAASFDAPRGIRLDGAGNVYVADSLNHRVRKVTPAGVVSTLAGSGTAAFLDATGAAASFNGPSGLALDGNGNVYVADTLNHRIRKITTAGVVTTFAGSGQADHFDGTGAVADFNSPRDVAFASTGLLYVADTGNHRIRGIAIATAQVVSVAGSSGPPDPGFANGLSAAAKFNNLSSLVSDAAGANVFVADTTNHRIRALATASADVTTPAGSGSAAFANGSGVAASFNGPSSVAIDAASNVYIADAINHRIRKMTFPAGVVTTVAGTGSAGSADGALGSATFDAPSGIALDAAGAIYVSDSLGHRIRKIVSLSKGQLAVSWTAPAAGGPVTAYIATASAPANAAQTCMVAAPATSCTITGLASGVAYEVSVVATGGGGTGAASPKMFATPN